MQFETNLACENTNIYRTMIMTGIVPKVKKSTLLLGPVKYQLHVKLCPVGFLQIPVPHLHRSVDALRSVISSMHAVD